MLKSSQTTNYINALYTLYGKICSTFIIFQNVIKIFYFKTRETLPYAKKKKKKKCNGLNILLSYSHAPSPNVFV